MSDKKQTPTPLYKNSSYLDFTFCSLLVLVLLFLLTLPVIWKRPDCFVLRFWSRTCTVTSGYSGRCCHDHNARSPGQSVKNNSAEMISLSSFLKRLVQKVSMTRVHRHVCLYLWVGSLLLEMVEDRRDAGQTCSGPACLTGAQQRDADRDGNTEQHVFDFTLEQKNCLYCFIWCLTVLFEWMLLSETVPEVGVWCQYRSLSAAQEAPVFL